MDGGQVIAIVVVTLLIFSGIMGLTSMFLSHRRDMAQIKHGKSHREAALGDENSELRETVGLMQERLAVLEQIATDPARRTAEQIEQLR